MSLTKEILDNAWKVAGERYVDRTKGPIRVAVESQLLPFLLSPRNKNAGGIASLAANTLKKTVDENGKDVFEVNVRWPQSPNQNAPRVDTRNGFCGLRGQAITYNSKTYRLTKTTTASVLIDGNIANCIPETRQQYFDDSYATLVSNAAFNWARDIEDELFALTSGPTPSNPTAPRQFRNIGNAPKLQASVVRYPGEDLPLFQTDNSKINGQGDIILERDRELGGIMDRVFLGDYSLTAYYKYKDLAGLDGNGYDFSKLEQINAANTLRSNRIYSNTGLRRPMLSLPVGHVQVVHHAEFDANPDITARFSKTAVTDPVFGVRWNLIAETIDCEDNGHGTRRSQTNLTLEIVWTLVVTPKCDPNDLRLDGTNGLYLYNIVCSDDTICELPPVEKLYNSASMDKSDCGLLVAERCDASCNVALFGDVVDDDYIISTNYQPSLGATAVTYAWTVDGTPTGGNTPTLTLDNDLVFGGEVVTVTITDSLNCVAVNQFIIDKACPRPSYLLKIGAGAAVAVTNGQTVTAGTIADGALITLTIENDAASNTDLVVTDGDITGDITSVVLPTFPETVAPNGETSIKGNASSTIGSYTAVLTVASNDCNDPAFTITVEYDIA